MSTFSLIMLYQQPPQPQPFEYGVVEPPDIQGWIEITKSSCSAEDHNPAADVASIDGLAQADATNEATANTITRRSRASTGHSRSGEHAPTIHSSPHGKIWEDRRVFSITQELAHAADAINNAQSMMDKASSLADASEELAHLEKRVQRVMAHIKSVLANASSIAPEAGEVQPVCHQRPLRSDSMDSTRTSSSDKALSDVSVTSSNMPPGVDLFFECAREVDILEQRIAELRRAVEEREAAKSESAEPQCPPNHQVEVDEIQMSSLQSRLASARVAEAEQRALLLTQGIDPAAFRWRRFSSSTA